MKDVTIGPYTAAIFSVAHIRDHEKRSEALKLKFEAIKRKQLMEVDYGKFNRE